MTVFAPTDRPKSVRNRCVIERFEVPLSYFDYELSVVQMCLSYDCVISLSFSLYVDKKAMGPKFC